MAVDQCSICFNSSFKEPVAAHTDSQGNPIHQFDRACLEEWLKFKRTCPICREEIPVSFFVKIRHLSSRSLSWLQDPIHQIFLGNLGLMSGLFSKMRMLFAFGFAMHGIGVLRCIYSGKERIKSVKKIDAVLKESPICIKDLKELLSSESCLSFYSSLVENRAGLELLKVRIKKELLIYKIIQIWGIFSALNFLYFATKRDSLSFLNLQAERIYGLKRLLIRVILCSEEFFYSFS